MCGIGAILDARGRSHPDAGERMVGALRHRGPDGSGVARLGPLTLAHTRLAIIDPEGGEQPLSSEDGQVTAVVNGEIYNHRELRQQLEAKGHRFATGSDSEVVVHGYEEHGPDFVRDLNGIFAFALWDAPRQRLVAARDHFGVKPLYWWSDGERTAVTSEISALLAAGLVTPEVDETALDHYLACRFVPAPRTLFRNVSKLPAASTLVVEHGGAPRIESFREPPGDPVHQDEATLAADLAERFADAVERQMMSDVGYGAFLSGGVDSAGVVAAMAKRGERPPQTFTIGFPGHGSILDEREYAAQSARLLGTEHHETAMEETGFLAELERSVPRLEEPCGIPSAGALLQLSRFAAEEVKVVLAGQGADEPHGGYGRHRAARHLGKLRALPHQLATPAAALARALPRAARARRAAHVLGGRGSAGRMLRLVEVTDREVRDALTGHAGGAAEAERLDLARAFLMDVPQRDLLDQALHLDAHVFLPDGILICNDKMSMAASLELRVPYLDRELMRFVERIPAAQRVGKRLHRAAMERLVPAEIVRRPKHGFATPYDDWLRAALGQEVERRYAPGEPVAAHVRPEAVRRLVDEHRRGRANHKAILFCLLELSEWHRAFVEARSPVAA
jgi:asparagine synthase (glutamine-hydrolysing)